MKNGPGVLIIGETISSVASSLNANVIGSPFKRMLYVSGLYMILCFFFLNWHKVITTSRNTISTLNCNSYWGKNV